MVRAAKGATPTRLGKDFHRPLWRKRMNSYTSRQPPPTPDVCRVGRVWRFFSTRRSSPMPFGARGHVRPVWFAAFMLTALILAGSVCVAAGLGAWESFGHGRASPRRREFE